MLKIIYYIEFCDRCYHLLSYKKRKEMKKFTFCSEVGNLTLRGAKITWSHSIVYKGRQRKQSDHHGREEVL